MNPLNCILFDLATFQCTTQQVQSYYLGMGKERCKYYYFSAYLSLTDLGMKEL